MKAAALAADVRVHMYGVPMLVLAAANEEASRAEVQHHLDIP